MCTKCTGEQFRPYKEYTSTLEAIFLKLLSGWVYRVLQHSAGPYGPYEGVLHMAGELGEKYFRIWKLKKIVFLSFIRTQTNQASSPTVSILSYFPLWPRGTSSPRSRASSSYHIIVNIFWCHHYMIIPLIFGMFA